MVVVTWRSSASLSLSLSRMPPLILSGMRKQILHCLFALAPSFKQLIQNRFIHCGACLCVFVCADFNNG